MNVREFDYPYEKRAYFTKSSALVEKGWSKWLVDRIDQLQSEWLNGCKLSVQIQNLGGVESRFWKNRDNGCSYSWRDSTICCVLDCFFQERSKDKAIAWQMENDKEGIGPAGKFSLQDRRMLWGSYGDLDLDKCWNLYYDSRSKYDRIVKTKQRVDPTNVFTPNLFCVGKPQHSLLSLAQPFTSSSDRKKICVISFPAPSNIPKWDDQQMALLLERKELPETVVVDEAVEEFPSPNPAKRERETFEVTDTDPEKKPKLIEK